MPVKIPVNPSRKRSPNRDFSDGEIERAARNASTADGYAAFKLGLKLHPTQAQVLRAIFTKPGQFVSFRCANEVGKTTSVLAPAILYALDLLNAQAISTAGKWMQVKDQLIPALKAHAWRFPGWRFLDTSISIGGIDRYVGFSTRDEGFAQGFHRRPGMPLFAGIDEAAAVSKAVFNGVEERCNPDYMLVTGSPLGPAGEFYDIETKHAKHYRHFKLAKPECTVGKGWWLADEAIERVIDKHGQDNPLVQSSVFGDFSSKLQYALLSLAELDACYENPPIEQGIDRHAFIDFAAGRAKNVFAVRRGSRVWIAKKWTERNTMAACGECIALMNKLANDIGLTPEEVEGDADGLGLPMVQRIQEMGYPIAAFHGGAKPTWDDDYADGWSEAWGCATKQMQDCEIILCKDEDLKAQLLSRELRRNSSGKFKLESKEEMAKRGVESPDEADAVCRAMMPAISTGGGRFGSGRDTRPWLERAEEEGEGQAAELPGAWAG